MNQCTANVLVVFGEIGSAGDGDADQGREENKKAEQGRDNLAQGQAPTAREHGIAGKEQAGEQGIGDAVYRLFDHDDTGVLPGHIHDAVVEEVDQRHAEAEPVEGVGQDQADFATGEEPADHRHLGGEDDAGIRMVPGEIGVGGDEGGGDDSPPQAVELQRQQGEDAAEVKVDIEEEWKAEIVAGYPRDHQREKDGKRTPFFFGVGGGAGAGRRSYVHEDNDPVYEERRKSAVGQSGYLPRL